MAIIVDTSVFITLERRGDPLDVLAHVVSDPLAAIASITASELLTGVHLAQPRARQERRREFVEAILAEFTILPFDIAVAKTHAMIWADLSRAGRLINAHDVLIAATALHHAYDVLTEDVNDFGRVPNLVVRQPQWPVLTDG